MAKWTRRAFIATGVVAGGALVVGVAIRPGNRNAELSPRVAEGDQQMINAWVKIDADNKVTVIVPHSEMGQGAQTALAQMLAEELDARWEDVSFIEAPAIDEYANYKLGLGYLFGDVAIPGVLMGSLDGALFQVAKSMHMQITGGSLSVRTTGVYGMRVAGAAAREMLIKAAAEVWSVPEQELDAREGQIIHAGTQRSAPFAEFAARAASYAPSYAPRLKDPKDFRVIGTSVARHDIPAKVDGSARFGIDVDVPGMQIATLIAAPVFGAELESVDDAAARSMPGVSAIVRLKDAVAVVAEGLLASQTSAGNAQRSLEQAGSGRD